MPKLIAILLLLVGCSSEVKVDARLLDGNLIRVTATVRAPLKADDVATYAATNAIGWYMNTFNTREIYETFCKGVPLEELAPPYHHTRCPMNLTIPNLPSADGFSSNLEDGVSIHAKFLEIRTPVLLLTKDVAARMVK